MKQILFMVFAFIGICVLWSGCSENKTTINFISDNEIYLSIEYSKQDGVVLPHDPKKEGYIFDGWFLDEGTWKNLISNGDILTNESNTINVYAKWIEDNQMTIFNYFLFGGFNNEQNPIYATEEEIILKEPKKIGYKFEGWFSEYNYVNRIYKVSANLQSKNFFAKWSFDNENCFTHTVLSNSMYSSGFKVGDVVICQKKSDLEINVGDIIVFYAKQLSPEDELIINDQKDRILMHRVLNETIIDGVKYYQTKVDSNAAPDPYLIREDLVLGIYCYNLEQLKVNYNLSQNSTKVFGLRCATRIFEIDNEDNYLDVSLNSKLINLVKPLQATNKIFDMEDKIYFYYSSIKNFSNCYNIYTKDGSNLKTKKLTLEKGINIFYISLPGSDYDVYKLIINVN